MLDSRFRGNDGIDSLQTIRSLHYLFLPQRLFNIRQDVIDMLNANGQTDKIRRDACGQLFFRRQLLMRGGRRMNRQRFGITDIGPDGKSVAEH